MTISNAYLALRHSHFSSYLATAILLTYPNATRNDFSCVDTLRERLRARDYVGGDEPSLGYHLRLAKRLTKHYIRLAIQASPEWKKDRTDRYNAYIVEVKRQRAIDPSATFFSFEGSKYGKSKLSLKSYKSLFNITSAVDIKKALDAK